MNYLTNYYKNLSEQLQNKLNVLEAEIQNLTEDLASDGVGTIVQGYGTTNTNTTTNQNQNSDLNNFLQAWGSSDSQYDYNGDGVVDGNDLGIHLSRMLGSGRGSTPTTMASTRASESTPEVSGSTKRVAALDQPGTAKTPFVAAPYRAGAATSTNQRVPKTPYNNLISLTTEKLSKNQETPSSGQPITKAGTNPNNGPLNFDFNGDGYIDSEEQSRFEDEYVSETDIADMNGDGQIDQQDYDLFMNYIQQQNSQKSKEENTPYWTSQKTTNPETLFYGQRRRLKK